MFRLVGTSVVLGIALAVVGSAAWAQDQPPGDAHERAAQPSALSGTPDAHERASQPTAVIVLPDAHERVQTQPVVVAATTDSEFGWARVVGFGLIGAAVVLGVVALAIAVSRRPPRGHPPLAHR
jgi:hypothetical protein